jgi:predicted metal-dependent hydrolase
MKFMREVEHCIIYSGVEIGYSVTTGSGKNMKIAVFPDSRVVVTIPESIDSEEVIKRMLKRAGWIQRQQDYFRKFQPRTPLRCYIGGESHLYLGKQYRLKIISGAIPGVILRNGYLFVTVKGEVNPEDIKKQLDRWYRVKAQEHLPVLFEQQFQSFKRFDLTRPALCIRRLKKRWGSFSAKGTLSINVDIIKAPKECIRYVLLHELCHAVHHHHGKDFYRLLEQMMPDWEKRKEKLEMIMA